MTRPAAAASAVRGELMISSKVDGWRRKGRRKKVEDEGRRRRCEKEMQEDEDWWGMTGGGPGIYEDLMGQ